MKKNKKSLFFLIGGIALAVVLMVVGFFALRNVGAGKTADRPIKIGSVLDFNSFLGDGKKLSMPQAEPVYLQLTGDVTVSKEGVIAAGNIVYLDLNGHTVTGGTNRAFAVRDGASLTVTHGTVQTEGADADGGVFAVEGAGCALTLENVFAANTNDSHISQRVSGGVIYASCPGDAENCATVTLGQDVKIVGSISGLRRSGGSIMLNGNTELHIDGATVTGGRAGIAGNILLDGRAKMYMRSGTVSGGMAVSTSNLTGFGGNINAQSMTQVHIYGGTIAAGTAENSGGNLYIANTAGDASGLYLYGGTVEKGLAKMEGGNIYSIEKASVLRLYGGELTGGDATLGGNISIHTAALELRGSKLVGLDNCDNIDSGGNIYATNATVSIYDGIVDQGLALHHGGNIYVSDTVLDIYGGTITRGGTLEPDVNNGGGNVYAGKSSVVNLYGGEIKDGVANYRNDKEASAAGANVMVAGKSFMQMFGGTIADGTVHGAISRGGGVYVYGQAVNNDSVFHMYGGTIKNGLTDNKMRGMCIGSYSATKDTNNGIATARLFDGDILYTGPADSPDKVYTVHGNKTDKRDVLLYDPVEMGLAGQYSRTTVGACKDASHNTVTGEVAATCLTHGYTAYHCDSCGDWCKITAQPTGHTVETTAENGLTTHECTVCKDIWYEIEK